MPISLYDAAVRSFVQALEGLSGVLDKGLAHCRETGLDPDEVVQSRLIGDMNTFGYQVEAAAHHAWGAMEAARTGVFSPPAMTSTRSYAELQALVAERIADLKALSPDAVNALEGRDVAFKVGERSLPFVAEDFLLTFSQPNMYFHCATAYDLLRMRGAPLGKKDYMGRPAMKAS